MDPNPRDMAAVEKEECELSREETSIMTAPSAPEQEVTEDPGPKMESSEESFEESSEEMDPEEAPPKTKKAKKRKVYAEVWILKASRYEAKGYGHDDVTMVGVYSSKEAAIEEGWKTMQDFEGEFMWEDNSETIDDEGGILFSCFMGGEQISMSLFKVFMDKPSSFYF